MERINAINYERIQWCCQDRGITLEELAPEVGLAKATLDQLMTGQNGITFNQLQKIATFFNRGVLFFLESGPVIEEKAHTPQFRTLTNQKPKLDPKLKALIERVEKQREIYLSLREDLGDTDQPLFEPPTLLKHEIKLSAGLARKWLNLAELNNNFDSYRTAVQSRGILVFRSNGYNGPWQIPKESTISGFSLYDDKCPVIVVKKQDHESRQVFTLIHELGHLLLHQSSFIDENIDLYSLQGKEREANAFAGYLLVPDSFLDQIDDNRRPTDIKEYDDWLRPYREQWGVSGEVILRRLLDTQRLLPQDYDAYRNWRKQLSIPENEGGTRKYRHREPKHVFGEPFVRTVLDALSSKLITLAKASTYLDNLKIKDVHQLERHYAGV